MEKWLLSPPIAFLVILTALWLLMRLLSALAFRPKKHSFGETEPYTCGEKNYNSDVQPDYSTFFAFAFFFTLAHVATLIMTFIPVERREILVMPAVYIVGAMLGLYILLRNE